MSSPQKIIVVETLMNGFVGFTSELSADTFIDTLPERHRKLTQKHEVTIYEGSVSAYHAVLGKTEDYEPSLD